MPGFILYLYKLSCMSIMKNKNFKIALLLFGLMGCLSIVLCLVTGNSDPFIQYISYAILFSFPPILYLSGIFYLVYSMIRKKTNLIASIILFVVATIIFLLFYILAIVAVIIG